MDKRIAVVALALLVVAGAFLAWPTSVSPSAGAGAGAGAGAVPSATGPGEFGPSDGAGPVPVQPPETEISIKCRPMKNRLVTLYTEDDAKKIGAAAKAKYGTDDAVIVQCENHLNLDDVQLRAWVENELGFKP